MLVVIKGRKQRSRGGVNLGWDGKRVLLSILSLLLTMCVPVCINRKLAVQYGVPLILLPLAENQFSYHHPSCIFGTTVIISVDKEATFIFCTIHWSIDGKEVVRLSWNIKPGALSQSRASEPVAVVWSCSVEFQLLLQFSACIESNSSLLKSQTNRLVNMQLDKIEISVWCRTRFCMFPRLYGENLSRVHSNFLGVIITPLVGLI